MGDDPRRHRHQRHIYGWRQGTDVAASRRKDGSGGAGHQRTTETDAGRGRRVIERARGLGDYRGPSTPRLTTRGWKRPPRPTPSTARREGAPACASAAGGPARGTPATKARRTVQDKPDSSRSAAVWSRVPGRSWVHMFLGPWDSRGASDAQHEFQKVEEPDRGIDEVARYYTWPQRRGAAPPPTAGGRSPLRPATSSQRAGARGSPHFGSGEVLSRAAEGTPTSSRTPSGPDQLMRDPNPRAARRDVSSGHGHRRELDRIRADSDRARKELSAVDLKRSRGGSVGTSGAASRPRETDETLADAQAGLRNLPALLGAEDAQHSWHANRRSTGHRRSNAAVAIISIEERQAPSRQAAAVRRRREPPASDDPLRRTRGTSR